MYGRRRRRIDNVQTMTTTTALSNHLVKDVPDVRLRLAKPHGEQLGALDRDEVRLALVGDRLREQRLAAAWRPVEEDALWRGHAELQVLVGVLDGVLDKLLQLALHALQTPDVGPTHVGHLHRRLTQRAGVTLTHRPLQQHQQHQQQQSQP